jgi:hypothetical protein
VIELAEWPQSAPERPHSLPSAPRFAEMGVASLVVPVLH